MEPQDDNLSIHSAETIEVANCSERLRGFAVRLVISLVVIGACAGALVWSVENGEAGTYNGPVNVRNASVNFSIFVDEFSVSKGVYSVRYRLPDSVNGSIGVPQVYPSFWYQDNTNKRLVHQINAYATIYAMDSYSFWVNYDEAGNISSCRYDNNTSYQLYIDRLGLTNLTHEYSAMEHIRNHKRVFIYEGDSSDVHLEFIPQSAFLVTTYADAETGALLGWDTYFSMSSTSSIYEISYWYDNMRPSKPNPKWFDPPTPCQPFFIERNNSYL